MTEHGHLRHVLSEYLEGELLLSERQTVERHLKICAVCRQELRILSQTVGALQRLPSETTPPDFMDKLRIRIEQHHRKSQPMAEPVPATPPLAALARWVLGLRQLLFFPLSNKIAVYAGIVILGFATILLRTLSSEQTPATQVSPTVSAPLHSKALLQGMVNVVDETTRAVATVESVPTQLPPSATFAASPTKALDIGSALVWRVTGDEPAILRQKVKALVSQKAEVVVVQEEEYLLVISLPTARLPALRQDLNTLGTANLSEVEIVPNTSTTEVHIEFPRSPPVVAPSNPAQLPSRS
jgi:hypothetical protein